jgi:hypothetical protein
MNIDPTRHYAPEGKAVCGAKGNGIIGPLVTLTLTVERTNCPLCQEIALIMSAMDGRMG